MNILEIFTPIKNSIIPKKAFFIIKGNREATMSIVSVNIDEQDFKHTKENLDTEIENVLESLNLVQCDNQYQYKIYCLEVCKKSGRGIVNTQYKNFHFYLGNHYYDRIMYVLEYNNKFAIIKSPNFDLLGFKLSDEDNLKIDKNE